MMGVSHVVAWQLLLLARLSLADFSFRRRAAAQGLVEYALIIMLLAVVVIGIMTLVGQALCTSWYLEWFSNPSSPFYDANQSC
jgi:hypothetical protein